MCIKEANSFSNKREDKAKIIEKLKLETLQKTQL